ncbi:Transglutaminase-like superfamily protein [Tenacibaculum sp. MAR_2009_124]|uniref:transglutaminase-like domain-containing protein n=1 Tax=Tenacibaculum sp. MAR_2009_124 TaxID=1250059 RepID=UPI0008990311|nr:transglutaminase-like domain-containing protein [Tenacibaculum sp. MAR_2009_124]SEC20695.1 Transglutaminase-like superfamily protein [Tenacibaculum sp. MAR_2009_124]
MNNCIIKLLLLLAVFYNLNGYSQDIELKLRSENIEVIGDSLFINKITIHIKENSAPRFYSIFYDSELERVANIKLYIKKRNRYKQEYIKKVFEKDAKLDYINSKKIKSVLIPANSEVKLTYHLHCKELMYLSSLHFFSYNKIDTLKYQIRVPAKYKLKYNTVYKDSLSFFKMDSTISHTNTVWDIKVSPKKVKPDPLQFFGIYKNMEVPLMRTLVVPKSYEDKAIEYLNDWYMQKLLPVNGISESVKQKIDSLTEGITDSNEIVKIIYDYVRDNFKYVAIEVGMGAFVPSSPNEVFSNKQGDCKDLSNFLSEVLRYKGVNSDIALAATFDHISDCDFPSLSSANHVVNIAYINGEKIILDPTDPSHVKGMPVQSLQDRSILIMNKDGGIFHKVESFNPDQNEIYYSINLNMSKGGGPIDGKLNITYKGLSGSFLRYVLSSEVEKDFENFGEEFYEEVLGKQTVSDLSIVENEQSVKINGNIEINDKAFSDGANLYFFIDFLPKLMESEDREELLEGTRLTNPFRKRVLSKIVMEEPIKEFTSKEHIFEEEGVSLELKIRYVGKYEIECSYDFICNYVFVERGNIEYLNKILKSFKKIINEPIVIEKHKN